MSTLEALQSALAAEHAALYVVGALGAQTSRSGAPGLHAALQDAYVQHRAQRDRLVREVTDRGAEPVAAEPAYELPARLGTVAAVEARARRLEEDCTATYAALVAHTTGSLRRWAVEVLTASALRELAFGGEPTPLPGIDAGR